MTDSQHSLDGAATERVLSLLSNAVQEHADWSAMSKPVELSSTAASEERESTGDAASLEPYQTSMRTVRHFLSGYLQAAGQQLLSAAWLLHCQGAGALVSIRTLVRASCEASSLAFWLCELDIDVDERLRRCNQLQVRSWDIAYTMAWMHAGVLSSQQDSASAAKCLQYRDQTLAWAHNRSWTGRSRKSRGRTPTAKQWIAEIPTITELLGQMTATIDCGSELGKALYKSLSGTAHADPLSVLSDLWEEGPVSPSYRATLAVGTAVGTYGLMVQRISLWTGWENNIDAWCYTVMGILALLCEQHGSSPIEVST